jgi:predicted nucleotide-binding protein
VARDNVVFELGLFLGALGPRHVGIIQPRDAGLTLPSDLAGVTRLDYGYSRTDQNLRAAIGPEAARIPSRMCAAVHTLPSSKAPPARRTNGLLTQQGHASNLAFIH